MKMGLRTNVNVGTLFDLDHLAINFEDDVVDFLTVNDEQVPRDDVLTWDIYAHGEGNREHLVPRDNIWVKQHFSLREGMWDGSVGCMRKTQRWRV